MKMKNKFFIKSLIPLAILIMVPVLILGSLSILIAQKYISNQIDKNSESFLGQVMNNFEFILNDADTLAINFDGNSMSAYYLNSIFNDRVIEYPLVDISVTNIISSNVSVLSSTKPYIKSIYIYYENDKDKVFTSQSGMTHISALQNTKWYEKYKNTLNPENLYDSNNIYIYKSEEYSQKTISIFKRLSNYQGCIVLNINATYIQQILDSIILFPNQSIYVFDKNNNVLFNSGTLLDSSYLRKAYQSDSKIGLFTVKTPKYSYAVTYSKSTKNAWTYVSATPLNVIYSIPMSISKYTITLSLIALLLGIIFSYILTKNNYSRIINIINIFHSAEKGEILPALPDKVKDEYGYILQNIIKTFIEKSYLSVQLSMKQYQLQALELLALQSQINPHFLYNTLNSIYWEVIKFSGGPNKANKMIENLSDILRYALENPDGKVLLRDELKFTVSYVNIQIERNNDKFDFITNFYEAELMDLKVMKLILQPFIENSISHGVMLKNEKCKIRLKVFLLKDRLCFSIFDNGIGFEKQNLIAIRQKLASEYTENSKHIGIFNTVRRLKLVYGSNCDFKIISTSGRGTVVLIKLPINL